MHNDKLTPREAAFVCRLSVVVCGRRWATGEELGRGENGSRVPRFQGSREGFGKEMEEFTKTAQAQLAELVANPPKEGEKRELTLTWTPTVPEGLNERLEQELSRLTSQIEDEG